MMTSEYQHPVLPKATHDERARQEFVMSFKGYLQHKIFPSIKTLYEQEIEPELTAQNTPNPQPWEIRRLMKKQPRYQWMGALKRLNQEMLWQSVSMSVERQLSELIERSKPKHPSLGSLTLDPNFTIPSHQTQVDIHCMPGGYHTEDQDDDVTAGAIYDHGVYLYGLGWLGSLNDDLGQSLIHHYLKDEYPQFQPQNILDLGCSVGHSTLPYVEAYPEAEVHGVDLSAPLLRYGHGRAEALNRRVHFHQQNAESMTFADGSFDLIVSHILFHEIPVSAIRRVLKECDRLLRPGGMMVHLESPPYSYLTPYQAFLFDWETANNNEPYWSAMKIQDLAALTTEAGFKPDCITQKFIPSWLRTQHLTVNKGALASRGTWFILAVTKDNGGMQEL
ncbi:MULTISPECIES: class I SAM-dependent methyltransferase [unclassified Roseofilum]|uniref:class I SAM-dependent methyltransferase n=1 Tax=unclassified Roseofilum TaxID=2620099 RepID=UPI00298DA512|nr:MULTISPECIES: class I SAM-dependent methyltransferase [unclassified Roseofilum]